MNYDLFPSLRMVLTSKCNGKCVFCHHEGYLDKLEMSLPLIESCAIVAEKLHIPSISLTGGEPTMHPDIAKIISKIQQLYKGSISLTTNGYKLLELGKNIDKEIQNLNISITSFDQKVNQKFQNVDIEEVKNAILNFPSKQKNFNIVLGEKNYECIDDVIKFCDEHLINLDIMFELREYSEEDLKIQKIILNKLKIFSDPVVELGYPSCLSFYKNNETVIRIKHPKMSSIVVRDICKKCNEFSVCYEKVCAVRVYPNSSVSPCLSKKYLFDSDDVEKNITNAYNLFVNDELIMSLIS